MAKLTGYMTASELSKLNDGEWAKMAAGIAPHEEDRVFRIEIDPTDPNTSIAGIARDNTVSVKILRQIKPESP